MDSVTLKFAQTVADLGVSAIAIVLLFWLFRYLLSEHRKERDEYRKERDKMREEAKEISKEQVQVLKELTAAVRAINHTNRN